MGIFDFINNFTLNPGYRRFTRSKREHRAEVVAGLTMGQLSAKELFPLLRARRLRERPIIGQDDTGEPVYGKSTFQNRIDENGRWV